jgi:hypothetical protein
LAKGWFTAFAHSAKRSKHPTTGHIHIHTWAFANSLTGFGGINALFHHDFWAIRVWFDVEIKNFRWQP